MTQNPQVTRNNTDKVEAIKLKHLHGKTHIIKFKNNLRKYLQHN